MIDGVKKSFADLLKRTRSAGSELRDGVESIRKRIRTLSAQKAEIERLPPPFETACARVDELIEYTVGASMSRTPPPIRFTEGPKAYRVPQHVDREDLIAAYLAPQLAEAMKAEVATIYETRPGISDDERAERLRVIDRELLDAELAEESIIRTAEAAGFPIHRRPDADPRAVLAHDKVLP